MPPFRDCKLFRLRVEYLVDSRRVIANEVGFRASIAGCKDILLVIPYPILEISRIFGDLLASRGVFLAFEKCLRNFRHLVLVDQDRRCKAEALHMPAVEYEILWVVACQLVADVFLRVILR